MPPEPTIHETLAEAISDGNPIDWAAVEKDGRLSREEISAFRL